MCPEEGLRHVVGDQVPQMQRVPDSLSICTWRRHLGSSLSCDLGQVTGSSWPLVPSHLPQMPCDGASSQPRGAGRTCNPHYWVGMQTVRTKASGLAQGPHCYGRHSESATGQFRLDLHPHLSLAERAPCLSNGLEVLPEDLPWGCCGSVWGGDGTLKVPWQFTSVLGPRLGLCSCRRRVVMTEQACSPVMNEHGERLLPNSVSLRSRGQGQIRLTGVRRELKACLLALGSASPSLR